MWKTLRSPNDGMAWYVATHLYIYTLPTEGIWVCLCYLISVLTICLFHYSHIDAVVKQSSQSQAALENIFVVGKCVVP